jgi:serine/threonine protein kinase
MHQESSLRSRKSLPKGHELLSYKIEIGITYLATDTNLNRAVAIKEYFPEQLAQRDDDGNIDATSEAESKAFVWGRERFLKEGQILARFSNPNIVSVLDFFELHNTSYMVMEYESGESLKSVIHEGRRLSEADVLEILLPLLRSLARFHNEGFIHRDIKPANILIRRDGTPVLLDFGSARQTVSGERLSLTSLVSPGYAPVEQYSDKGAHQGPWTDIYALGATFYHLLTGRMPATAMERTASLHDGSDPLTAAGILARGAYSEELLKAVDISMKLMERAPPQRLRVIGVAPRQCQYDRRRPGWHQYHPRVHPIDGTPGDAGACAESDHRSARRHGTQSRGRPVEHGDGTHRIDGHRHSPTEPALQPDLCAYDGPAVETPAHRR